MKARLVTKGYTQIPRVDFGETFSSVAKIASIHLLLFLATIYHCTLHQLDIKNTFLHEDLEEDVYMKQLLEVVAQSTLAKYVSSRNHYIT